MAAVIDRVFRCRAFRIAALLLIGSTTFLGVGYSQGKDDNLFVEEVSYINNKRFGERLTIVFPNAPSEVTRTTSVVLFEEGYYNRDIGGYNKRMVAVITGMGLGTTGLKLVLSDYSQISLMNQCLNSFEKAHDSFLENRKDIEALQEDWMTDAKELIGRGRYMGDVFFYPSKKPLKTEFNWDFELDRIWLSMGDRVFVDQEVVPYIIHVIDHLDDYQQLFFEYRETIKSKNREIDTLLGVRSYR